MKIFAEAVPQPAVSEHARAKAAALRNIEIITEEINHRHPTNCSRAIIGMGLFVALLPAGQMAGQSIYDKVTHNGNTWQAIEHPFEGLVADLAVTGSFAALENRRHRTPAPSPASIPAHFVPVAQQA